MASITLTNISKHYPPAKRGQAPVAAVENLSLDIADGSFTVLVGPSGCGKSTTLRMVAGLEDLSAGQITIGGRIVAGERENVHPKDRDIAMVFQNYALYPHMTVRQNLGFALKMRKVSKPEIARRVEAVAATLGIGELLDRRPAALSGGQRQRVAVGRAIVREPKAFLFDEPLSNLDAKLRVSTRAELKALHQRLKTTTLYVTHDQEEAMTLGDRIVVMHKGIIQQAGPPLEVYRKPVNRFVASFIGTPPMNFVRGTLAERGAVTEFVESVGENGGAAMRVPVPAPAAAREFAGREVVLGIRPQALSVAAAGGTGSATAGRGTVTVPLRIEVVEPLGDQMDVSARTSSGTTPLVARIGALTDVEPGTTRDFWIDISRVHLFEPGEFGRALV